MMGLLQAHAKSCTAARLNKKASVACTFSLHIRISQLTCSIDAQVMMGLL
jgi:hypothetical protein